MDKIEKLSLADMDEMGAIDVYDRLMYYINILIDEVGELKAEVGRLKNE